MSRSTGEGWVEPLRSRLNLVLTSWSIILRLLRAPIMSSPVSVVLRLVGPLIEVICLALLQRWGGQGRLVVGVPIEYPLYVGLGLGLAMVVAGLTWFRPKRQVAGDGR